MYLYDREFPSCWLLFYFAAEENKQKQGAKFPIHRIWPFRSEIKLQKKLLLFIPCWSELKHIVTISLRGTDSHKEVLLLNFLRLAIYFNSFRSTAVPISVLLSRVTRIGIMNMQSLLISIIRNHLEYTLFLGLRTHSCDTTTTLNIFCRICIRWVSSQFSSHNRNWQNAKDIMVFMTLW